LRAMSFDELERRIGRMLARAKLDRLEASRAAELYREVTKSRGYQQTAYEAWAAFRTDEYFRLPAVNLADALTRGGSNVYLYRFDYPIPAFKSALGACHAAEVPLVFGTHRTRWLKPLYLGRRQADGLSGVIQEAWLSFALSGAPRDSVVSEWPVYDPSQRATRILDAPGRLEAVVEDPERETRQFWMGEG
ncbi:MAG: carboxylesterase family protein, partial [bacterium]|nr:carboxylesterase family protein [bacterium]